VSLTCLRAIARPERGTPEAAPAEGDAAGARGEQLAGRQRRAQRRAMQRIGGALLAVAVLLVGAVVALAFWRGNQLQLQTGLLVKAAVVAALVLLGMAVGAAATGQGRARQR
jgi:O-antigen ligase